MTDQSSRAATRDEEQYPAPIDLLTAEIEKLKRETDGGWSPDARSSLARIEFFTRRVLVEQIQSAESETGRWINSSDRLPEYADCEKASGYVLAWFKGCKHPEARHYINVREWQIGDDPIPHSYWMPLPEVPNV